MFEDAARKARYMAYTKSHDKVSGIEGLVDAETIERLGRYFDYRGYEEVAAEVEVAQTALRSDVAVPEGAVVTLLVEMSGSMSGRKLRDVSLAVLAAATVLEEKGARVEVLGFTTSGGKRPQKAWNDDRTIRYPGRLSELRHVVIKRTDEKVEQSVGKILAMASPGLNHENIDGEALQWAAERLAKISAYHRLLVPVCDADEPQCAVSWRFADDKDFMATHHREIVRRIEESGEMDLLPILLCEERHLTGTYSDPVLAEPKVASLADTIVRQVAWRLEAKAELKAAPEVATY